MFRAKIQRSKDAKFKMKQVLIMISDFA